jgi:hypothetical protein
MANIVSARFQNVLVLPEADVGRTDASVTLLCLGRKTQRASTTSVPASVRPIEISVEVGLGSADDAVCAIIGAMLDEPERLGPLAWS